MNTSFDGSIWEESAPLVSVVMPAYKVAPYIGEALDSVLTQTFSNYEIIVINDGSPDTNELEKVLEPHRDRIVYLKQENKGVSGARNTGIKSARGSYIALLDPDDIWEPEYLSTQLKCFENDPMIDVVYSDALLFGDPVTDGKRFTDICPSKGEVTIESLLAEECNVMLSGSVARREILLEVGMFDEEIRYTEDFELWLRVVKNGGRITYHRNALVKHRVRPDSTSASDPVWLYENILATLNRILNTWNLTSSQRAVLEQRLQFNSAMLHQFKGQKAFFSGDRETAIRELQQANLFFRKPKLSFVVFLIRFAPRLLLRMHNARARFLYKRGRTQL
jgi:glycosyltransferase involved in cell wall biosynthesis